MGNMQGAGADAANFHEPLQALLHQRDLKISAGTIKKIIKDIDKIAPWFVVSGDLNLASWNKLGKDLERAKQEDRIGKGTLPPWRLVRSCLRDDRHHDIIRAGRRVLMQHQDSLSESETRKEDIVRPKKKKDKIKEKPQSSKKDEESSDREPHRESEGESDSESDLELEEELDPKDKVLEETTARYEEKKYGRQRPLVAEGRKETTPLAPPPYSPAAGKCHFIKRKTWSRLAAAFPVFENAVTFERYFKPISYKQIKDLAEAVRTYGVAARFTTALLRRLTVNAMTPNDWLELARMCLNHGQFLDFRSIIMDKAQAQYKRNVQEGQPDWTVDMLLGQGQWAIDQTNYPWEVYRQINEIYYKAWRAIPNKGEMAGSLTKIIQATAESFSDFVTRMIKMAERVFGDLDASMPLVQQLIFEQSTNECQRTITPVKDKDLEVWVKACREVGGPLTNAGLAAAVLSATGAAKDGNGKGCFRCGQQGHFKR
ncbi:igE-binding protein-like [Peromyscus maniculatus bairdii]|uniref:igE-binding protein-like n=1 Tax=Peromyscus maniculatus bairdii TaxID=230844 RepID=UPI001C2E2B35|nr:igE-binding protein-like [Peromyscus maniculatus bairdii]